ncbi:hypothetical protein Micbo1qcDRAFT_168343 [Microdochium bolleyi]|uniref:Uncharacterized protein n=1 Tax=Microdochium bolleyi TaxID=196109 RepID=A0A136INQ0_9PEZI|nr:hypothetical protein Micbo1qcDRAFT_168343 [Microdochium bolleyi]
MSGSMAVQPVSASAAAAAGATDSMVLAILVLAVHDSIDLTPVPEPHPLAPLATYRDMHIYGQMAMRDEHMTALYKLVEQKGGLPQMNQTVFGYVLPPADMLYNLRRGTAPRVPCHRHLVPMRDTDDWRPDPRAEFLLGISGSAFRTVQCPHVVHNTSTTMPGMMPPSYSATATRTVNIGLEEEILSLLGLMAELTVAFDHYIRGNDDSVVSGSKAPRNLDFFVNNADLVAHRLLCLGSLFEHHNGEASHDPGAAGFTTTTSDYGRITSHAHSGSRRRVVRYPRYLVLREISRRAAIVYQDMVIFPTPARTGVKLRHARAMLPLLRALRPRNYPQQHQAAKEEAGAAAAARKYAVPGGFGYDYLLGEDIGRLHLRRHPHHHHHHQHGAMGARGAYFEDQLEVDVVYDDDEDGSADIDSELGSGEKTLLHDRAAHLLTSQSLPGSSTGSPAQHDSPLPGEHDQHHQHHHLHHHIHGNSQSETDFLSWATTLGAIVTRFTPLQDVYVAQLASDIEYNQNDREAEHFANPPMGPCHYPHEGQAGGSGGAAASWQDHKSRMMRFLWLDAVCDEPGQIVWEQALQALGSRREAG